MLIRFCSLCCSFPPHQDLVLYPGPRVAQVLYRVPCTIGLKFRPRSLFSCWLSALWSRRTLWGAWPCSSSAQTGSKDARSRRFWSFYKSLLVQRLIGVGILFWTFQDVQMLPSATLWLPITIINFMILSSQVVLVVNSIVFVIVIVI